MPIEDIIKSEEDFEIKKYKILSVLKYHEERIRKYLLYPTLTELVNSLVILEGIVNKAVLNFDEHEDDKFFLNNIPASDFCDEDEDELTALIKWAGSSINKMLDEAIAIFEFAEKNIHIGQLSGRPGENSEGYFIIPNLECKMANIYRYETVVFNSSGTPLSSVRTKHLISFSEKELRDNSADPAVKILMDYINDKGASVLFCSTDVGLPYEETILPVAKKNLLKYLSE